MEACRLNPPLEHIPYTLSETVGQYTTQPPAQQQAPPRGRTVDAVSPGHLPRSGSRPCARLRPHVRHHRLVRFRVRQPQQRVERQVKNPASADVSRIPELGATFYQSQAQPLRRPVIEPNFYSRLRSTMNASEGRETSPSSITVIVSRSPSTEKHLASLEPGTARDNRTCSTRLRGLTWRWMAAVIRSAHRRLRQRSQSADSPVLIGSRTRSVCRQRRRLRDSRRRVSMPRALSFRSRTSTVHRGSLVTATSPLKSQVRVELIGDQTFSLTESGGAGAVWNQVRSQRNRHYHRGNLRTRPWGQNTLRVTAREPRPVRVRGGVLPPR